MDPSLGVPETAGKGSRRDVPYGWSDRTHGGPAVLPEDQAPRRRARVPCAAADTAGRRCAAVPVMLTLLATTRSGGTGAVDSCG